MEIIGHSDVGNRCWKGTSRNPPRVLPATVSQRFQTGGEVKKKGASAKRHQNTGHSEFKAFFIWTIG